MAKFYDYQDDRPTKIEKLLRAYKENKLDDFKARDAFEDLIDDEVDFCEDDKDEIEDLKERLGRIADIADGYY
jgi:hypothetical protein